MKPIFLIILVLATGSLILTDKFAPEPLKVYLAYAIGCVSMLSVFLSGLVKL